MRGSGRRREVGDAQGRWARAAGVGPGWRTSTAAALAGTMYGIRGRWARAAGLWAATTTAAVLGDVGLARWGEQGTAAAPDVDETKCLGRAKEEGNIWGGPFVPGESTTRDKRTFCPGSWLHPGQKGFLGGTGKFPARGPPLVPGGSTTRDKRGFWAGWENSQPAAHL